MENMLKNCFLESYKHLIFIKKLIVHKTVFIE